MKRNVTVAVAVAAAIAIGATAIAVATGGGGGGSGSNGISRGPAASSGPITVGTSASSGSSGGAGGNAIPQVPHNNAAAIYSLFGARSGDVNLLDGLQARLELEGYEVTPYVDTTEGAGGHGGATLANFVGMAKHASVIIINAHGEDWSGTTQSCSMFGKGGSVCGTVGNPTRAPTPPPPATTRQPHVPFLQVEWYPSWAAEQSALKRYVAQGYNRSWLYDPFPDNDFLSTLIPARPGDWADQFPDGTFNMSVGLRPWLGITAAGIAHFFKGRQVDFIDNLACHSMAFAPSFDARSYFGHANLGCVKYQYRDEPTLFDRLIGTSGVAARTTTAAYGLGGFLDSYFQLAAQQPVVLSPAVEAVDPPDTARVAAGKKTTLTVNFDAVMDTASANDIVTVSGCGGTLGNPQWRGKDTLTVDLTVPKKPPNTTATLTVHHEQAHAPGDGDNQFLDGNTNPPAASGLAPNRDDDFTWTLSCDSFSVPPPPSTTAAPGRCNPGDVELRVHIYNHGDIGMTFTEPGSSTVQTSWPAGNAPFPNSFPPYPAPYLRYGCFVQGTTVHLTFNNSDEPWLLYWKTTGLTPTGGGAGSGCNLSRNLYKGMPSGPQLGISLSCDVVMTSNTDLNAYWVAPTYVDGALTNWTQYPGCPPNSPPHYCPPGS